MIELTEWQLNDLHEEIHRLESIVQDYESERKILLELLGRCFTFFLCGEDKPQVRKMFVDEFNKHKIQEKILESRRGV